MILLCFAYLSSLTNFQHKVLFLDLNNNRSLVAAAVNVRFRSKQGICQRFIVYKEKVNCQLSHPFSTVTVYIAKLLNLIRTFFSVPVMFSQNIKGLYRKQTYFRSSLSLSRACASRAYKGRLGGMQKLNFNETFESLFTVFSNPVYEGVVTLLLRR